jgi:spermidine/putrescine-binding protein
MNEKLDARSEDAKKERAKKELILAAAKEIKTSSWTPAEIDQLRRRLIALHGEAGKTGSDYITEVLKNAGYKLALTLQEDAEDQYEDEFEDILHFKTLQDAEVSLMRLDELMRRFQAHKEPAAVERVLNVARLGKRRAEMIARNHKVQAQKRAEKEEMASWFRIWLETPDAFFDWLDVRKQSAEFQSKFPQWESEE